MKVESQADIVAQMALYHVEGTETTEKIYLPGLNEWFLRPVVEMDMVEEEVRVPGLKILATRTRTEICDMLTGLPSFRKGLMGFRWRMGDDTLTVFHNADFEQNEYTEEADLNKLDRLFMTILKLRKSITVISWNFNDDFVEISYIA